MEYENIADQLLNLMNEENQYDYLMAFTRLLFIVELEPKVYALDKETSDKIRDKLDKYLKITRE